MEDEQQLEGRSATTLFLPLLVVLLFSIFDIFYVYQMRF